MEWKNLKLELGDKITFKSGQVDFIESYCIDRRNTLDEMYNNNKLNEIVKIERFDCTGTKGVYGDVYELVTIYEKPVNNTDKLQKIEIYNNKHEWIYLKPEYKGYRTDIKCDNEPTLYLAEKINEIIDYLNKEIK